MSNGLHLILDKTSVPDANFSQGELTLKKSGDFTVFISEKIEIEKRKLKLEKCLLPPLPIF